MSDKPFPCPHKGCSMTFVNEDHLNVHRKKHDMVLNLELIPKNNVSDQTQTPTPTRFIRNCEEVGLFQDLQNVNPFDDTFKKALEKSGYLPTPQPSSDDTLHTPNILPHITVTPTTFENSTFPLRNNIVEISDEDVESSEGGRGTADLQNNRNAVLEKLKKSINKPKILKIQANHNNNTEIIKRVSELDCKPDVDSKNISKQRRRENNRASQFRSRMKKKNLSLEIQNKMKELVKENDKLFIENQQLKYELNKIRTILEKHKQCQFDGEDVVFPELDSLSQINKEKNERLVMSKVEMVKPINTIFIQTVPTPLPAQATQIQIVLPGQMITSNNFLQESCKFESKNGKCAISKLKHTGHQNGVNLLKKKGKA